MSNSAFGIDITARNLVDKGAKAAETRLKLIPKHASLSNRKATMDDAKALKDYGRAALGTYSEIEKAKRRAEDVRSTRRTWNDIGRLSGAVADLGTGMGGAARAGAALADIMRDIGGRRGGYLGSLIDTATDVARIADAWNKNAVGIRNTAAAFGVGSRTLQTFTAAAERAGVDKGTASGAIGGLSQTLNDARYGRNTEATEVLRRLGVGMRLKSDGTVNVDAMLPDIASAIARQNSSGARTAARYLGIPEAALPAFRQGGRALANEMRDAQSTSMVYSDLQMAMAAHRERDLVRAQQRLGRAANLLGEGASGGLDLAFGSTVRESFKPATEKFEGAVRTFAAAIGASTVGSGGSGLHNGVLNLPEQGVIDLMKGVATEWDKKSIAQGHAIIDTMLNRLASGHWGNTMASVLNARSQFSGINGRPAHLKGIHSVNQLPLSIIDPRTKALVVGYLAERARGTPSIIGDNMNYANPVTSDRVNREGWIKKYMTMGPFGSGNSIHVHGTTPDLQRYRPGAFQVASPGQPVAPIPLHVTVEVKGGGPGTRATVRAGEGSGPAISHAYTPVHGG